LKKGLIDLETVLALKNVCKNFYTELGELKVLNNISFEVKKGEIIALIGPSGSGKTTLLNILAKIIPPTSGEVYLDGEIGYMFQRDHLLEWRTIWKNLLIGLEITSQNDEIHQERIKEMLRKYGLDGFTRNFPHELSGGMRQRIALIRTLSIEPKILLLDEPFSSLDYQTRLMVSDDIYHMIKTEKLTAILVTHDISEAISMADRIVVLSERPAEIINIHDIKLTINGPKTPLKARTADEFRQYFDQIWKELHK
jgi:NitT/TauT family transport system ATP-binding protein